MILSQLANTYQIPIKTLLCIKYLCGLVFVAACALVMPPDLGIENPPMICPVLMSLQGTTGVILVNKPPPLAC